MEPVAEIPLQYFVSYADTHGHIYGFDVRSARALLATAAETETDACNPYNRAKFPASFLANVERRITCLKRAGCPIDWRPPTETLTPQQIYTNTVVDTFCAIDALGYYTSPDWFFELNVQGHRRLYAELYTRWHSHTALQKRAIVPHCTDQMFRIVPHGILDLSLGLLADLTIRGMSTLVTAGAEKDDRVLGALDVLCALTVASARARRAYPWLYEHAVAPPPTPLGLFGRWNTPFVPLHILGNTYRL